MHNAQKFAAAVDNFDAVSSFTLRDRAILWRYFTQGYASQSHGEKGDVQKVKLFSNIMFRYKLLDVLANLFEVPHHPSLILMDKQHLTALPQRLQLVSLFLISHLLIF